MAVRVRIIVALVMFAAGPALADWDPGDGHKMHFPQLPDPNGWDVDISFETIHPRMVADDWQCSQSGYVNDIHFWFSWCGDAEGEIEDVGLAIFSDDSSGSYSKPGDLLWDGIMELHIEAENFTVRHWGTGDPGWYDPHTATVLEHDHQDIYQMNVEGIIDPFYQEEGTTYWLVITMLVSDGQVGCKTSLDHFQDSAVWYSGNGWYELSDPLTSDPLDLAFVIAPEPTTLGLLMLGPLALLRRRRA